VGYFNLSHPVHFHRSRPNTNGQWASLTRLSSLKDKWENVTNWNQICTQIVNNNWLGFCHPIDQLWSFMWAQYCMICISIVGQAVSNWSRAMRLKQIVRVLLFISDRSIAAVNKMWLGADGRRKVSYVFASTPTRMNHDECLQSTCSCTARATRRSRRIGHTTTLQPFVNQICEHFSDLAFPVLSRKWWPRCRTASAEVTARRVYLQKLVEYSDVAHSRKIMKISI